MTATTSARTSLLLRLGLLAASLCAVACDAEPQDSTEEICTPEDGCDGIVEVQERGAAHSANVEPTLSSIRRAHSPPSYEETFAVAERTNPVSPAPLALAADTCDRDDPEVGYVADDAEGCASIFFSCEPSWRAFENECGCGCEYTGATPYGLGLRAE